MRNTIDSWQGREMDFMIFSAVRSNRHGNIGFLKNERRTNVALSRAKHGMIIVGNAQTLSDADPNWKILIKVFIDNRNLVDGIEGLKTYIEKHK